jgi:two-component system sensor histidine kinase/response regulator
MEKKFRILYVDDESRNLQLFQSAFEKEFDVTTCVSPLQAQEIIKTNSFEIIMADQRMSEMNGVDFLEVAHHINDAPVRILLTGFCDFQASIEAINRGKIFYYCTKPWKKEELKMILLKSIEHFLLMEGKRQLIKKLSESVKELELFLYRASHDLRAPIATQLGLLHLLKTEITGEAKIYVQKIEEMISRLEHTLEKIKQLSCRTKELVEKKLSSNMEQLVANSMEKFKKDILEKGIRIETQFVSNPDHYFDRSTVQIILDNVIENAIQFSRPGVDSFIRIETWISVADDHLQMSIEDNGTGIPLAVMDKIYDPFFRGSIKSTGNGLGLFVVKKFCEVNHYDIKVESDAASWTKFTLSIPNAAEGVKLDDLYHNSQAVN